MTIIIKQEELSNVGKANIYRLLSACYYQPCPEMLPLLINLEDWLERVFPAGAADVVSMRRELEQQGDNVDKLLIDYARLFIGPFTVLAPPYGSVYLEEGRKVMGDTTIGVNRFYQALGINLDEEQKDLPDHIAVELEFLYYLLLQKHDEEYRLFLESYVVPWVGKFGDAVESNAETEFYHSLARITRNFVAQEAKNLSLVFI